MLDEIKVATSFLVRFLRSAPITPEQKQHFQDSLVQGLLTKFKGIVWDPSQPLRGNANRSLLISRGFTDPVIITALLKVGLVDGQGKGWLPSELIIWIDPGEVTYRFGDHGSIANLPLTSSAPPPGIEDLPKMTASSSTPPVPIPSRCLPSISEEGLLPTTSGSPLSVSPDTAATLAPSLGASPNTARAAAALLKSKGRLSESEARIAVH